MIVKSNAINPKMPKAMMIYGTAIHTIKQHEHIICDIIKLT